MSKRTDYTGQQFNEITVLEYDEELSRQKKRTFWKCRCSCGREKSIRTDVLKNIQTCGECNTMSDIAGQRFGRLVALQKNGKDKNRHTIWTCQCDCGNIKDILATHLKTGKVQSCGCLLAEKVKQPRPYNVNDLTGQRFGKLVAQSYTIENGHARWLCKCDCGNVVKIYGTNLVTGQTRSCGCMKHSSYGEATIQQFLEEHSITFQREYYFNNLRLKLPLRFDFAIFDKKDNLYCLIEYQGIQHYEKQNSGWGDVQRNITDPMKIEYCQNNNIPLYMVRYDEDIYDRLEEIFNGTEDTIPEKGAME